MVEYYLDISQQCITNGKCSVLLIKQRKASSKALRVMVLADDLTLYEAEMFKETFKRNFNKIISVFQKCGEDLFNDTL